jgi:hypothetical protein
MSYAMYRRLFEPLISDFFNARKAGVRGDENKNARVSREKRVFTVGAVSGHAMPSPRTLPPKPARVIIMN